VSQTASIRIARPTADIQHAYVAIMPRIVNHARICFRHMVCNDSRENAIAEVVALTWMWFARLVEKGRHPEEFVSVMAVYAARAVKCGRRLCGQERANDILSPLAQNRGGFTVSPLPEFSTLDGNELDEALQDNMQTPVIDQVIFRVDFPNWLSTRTERDRLIIRELMSGERTLEVSQKYRVSQPRISQLRREYLEDWDAFCKPDESAMV
jgi:hypothetical protein